MIVVDDHHPLLSCYSAHAGLTVPPGAVGSGGTHPVQGMGLPSPTSSLEGTAGIEGALASSAPIIPSFTHNPRQNSVPQDHRPIGQPYDGVPLNPVHHGSHRAVPYNHGNPPNNTLPGRESRVGVPPRVESQLGYAPGPTTQDRQNEEHHMHDHQDRPPPSSNCNDIPASVRLRRRISHSGLDGPTAYPSAPSTPPSDPRRHSAGPAPGPSVETSARANTPSSQEQMERKEFEWQPGTPPNDDDIGGMTFRIGYRVGPPPPARAPRSSRNGTGEEIL